MKILFFLIVGIFPLFAFNLPSYAHVMASRAKNITLSENYVCMENSDLFEQNFSEKENNVLHRKGDILNEYYLEKYCTTAHFDELQNLPFKVSESNRTNFFLTIFGYILLSNIIVMLSISFIKKTIGFLKNSNPVKSKGDLF